MNFKFSTHSLYRISEVGMAQNEIVGLWDNNKFVQYYSSDHENRFVAFIPHLKEYYSLIVGNERVITFLPLTHRINEVNDNIKLDVYKRAFNINDIEKTEPPQTTLLHLTGIDSKTYKHIKLGVLDISSTEEDIRKFCEEEIRNRPNRKIEMVTLHKGREYIKTFNLNIYELNYFPQSRPDGVG